MSEKDEALVIADELGALMLADELGVPYQCDFHAVCEKAATELRRQHAEIGRLRELVRHILGDRITPEAYLLFGKAWVDEAHATLRREPGDG